MDNCDGCCHNGLGGYCDHDVIANFQNKIGAQCQTRWLGNEARRARGTYGYNRDDAFDGWWSWDYFDWNDVLCVAGNGFYVPNKVKTHKPYVIVIANTTKFITFCLLMRRKGQTYNRIHVFPYPTKCNLFQEFHEVWLEHRGSDGWTGDRFIIRWTDGTYTDCRRTETNSIGVGFLDDNWRKYYTCNCCG